MRQSSADEDRVVVGSVRGRGRRWVTRGGRVKRGPESVVREPFPTHDAGKGMVGDRGLAFD